MHLPPTSFAPGPRFGNAKPWLVKTALAAGLLTGGLALSAQAADAANSVKVKVKHDTLTIDGTKASDKLALRLGAGAPQTLQVDVNDDGSADFRVARDRFERIRVKAHRGDDLVRIDETNGAFTTTTPTQIDGQQGNDTIVGGSGDETLNGGTGDDSIHGGPGVDVLAGGDGNDAVDGDQGADTALLGAGDDRFTWDPGDGSDVVEGQAGKDAMTFNGSNGDERFDVSANGSRVRFLRNVGTIDMDLNSIEEVDVNALGGADQVTVNDLSGTDLTEVKSDLAAAGGVVGDNTQDQVIVKGTDGADAITAAGSAGNVRVNGLAARIDIAHAQVAQDQLAISGLAGDDVIDGSGLAADAIQFHADGGDGNDMLIGGAGSDTLAGGAGDDVLQGGPAQDVLDGGPGSNVVIQD